MATFAPPQIGLLSWDKDTAPDKQTQKMSTPEGIISHLREMNIFYKTSSFKTSGQFPRHISAETCYKKLIITFANQETY